MYIDQRGEGQRVEKEIGLDFVIYQITKDKKYYCLI